MANTFSVANRFISLAKEHDDTLTPMQILKLVYIAHGWMLGLHGKPLIRDDIQAWQYGPVIPRLYDAIRHYRSQPVEDPIQGANGELDEKENNIVEQVYEVYGKMTGPALSRLTHAKGTPWDLTYQPGKFGVVISNDIIEDHYNRLAKARSELEQ